MNSHSILKNLGLLLTTLFIFNYSFADAVDDAAVADRASLCAGSAANKLSNIAKQKKYSDSERSRALAYMIELSRECNDVSDNRLKQFHQKLISASHKLLELSDTAPRRTAIEGIQYVVLQPTTSQPPEGAITRGQALTNTALNDSDMRIRLWALEALVTLESDKPKVASTLATAATSDPEPIVREIAQDMHNELFGE